MENQNSVNENQDLAGESAESPHSALEESYWRACIRGFYDAVKLDVYCAGSYENYGKDNQVFHPRTERQDGYNDASEDARKKCFAYMERCLNPSPRFPMQVELVASGQCLWGGDNGDVLEYLCSDVFAWGCADAEDVANDELPELYALWKSGAGTTRWILKKRNEQPQLPLKKQMIESGEWDAELEALPENSYDKWCREKNSCTLHGAESVNAPERGAETDQG